MSTINFYLKKADKKGDCPIMLTYQSRGAKFRYYTRQKVKAIAWNGQRVKTNFTGFSEINGILDDIENIIKSIEREALSNKKEYSIDTIRRKFFLQIGELNEENDFLKTFDSFIEDSRPTKTIGTIKTYEGTKAKLTAFSEKKNIPLTFEAIDQSFYETFLNYLLKDLKHLNNTAGRHIKTLKVFLNYAMDHEYTAIKYNVRKFKVFKEDVDIIYLTEPELMKIYNLENLPDRLSEVRDCFCFACFTGIRFSDLNKLNFTHIKKRLS